MKRTQEQRDLIMAYKTTFGTAEGKAALVDLSRVCMENAQTFIAGHPDLTEFNQGLRGVILYIRKKIEANLDDNEPETARTQETL
jgi:hypothetical protein